MVAINANFQQTTEKADTFRSTLSAKDRGLRLLEYYGRAPLTQISAIRGYAVIKRLLTQQQSRLLEISVIHILGPFKCYVIQGGWGVQIISDQRYEGARSNVISVTRGWVGVKFAEKTVT